MVNKLSIDMQVIKQQLGDLATIRRKKKLDLPTKGKGP